MKIDVDKKLIDHVASVARLNLTEKEREQFLSDFKDILDAFSRLDEVDTEGVPIKVHPVDIRNSLRDDKPGTSFSQDEALSLVKNKKDGFFKGPRAV